MKDTRNIHVLFVINPKSGTANTRRLSSVIEEVSKTYGFIWEVFYTTGNNDKEKILEKIKKRKPGTIVAAGGDGTINLVARLIIKTNIKMGIIPMGSANGFAYNLRIPTNFEQALKIIYNNSAHPIDILRINKNDYCLHLSDIGTNARIVKRFEKEKSKGLIGYGKQLFKELLSGQTYFKYTIQSGKFTKKSKAEVIVIANAESFGTGAKINPGGSLNDGKFEIVVIKPYPWWAGFKLIFSFFSGKLHEMQYVRIYKTAKATIKLRKPQIFQLDGEIQDEVKDIEIELIRHGIQVIY
ncbi:MAG: diacylglycerol kinase family lipid kinase [Prolixibacteraceae bacterium]|nr:diacylglycerol kinase family lipid kinase [Prolixibacteraceae bacterium]